MKLRLIFPFHCIGQYSPVSLHDRDFELLILLFVNISANTPRYCHIITHMIIHTYKYRWEHTQQQQGGRTGQEERAWEVASPSWSNKNERQQNEIRCLDQETEENWIMAFLELSVLWFIAFLDLLFEEIGKRQEEKESKNVSVDRENNLANAHVKGSSGNHMETSIAKLQGQHGYVELKPFRDRTPHSSGGRIRHWWSRDLS